MRRWLSVVLVVIVAVVGFAPASGATGVYGYTGQFAWAQWIDMHGRTGTFYAVYADRYVSPVWISSYAFVVRGKCWRKSTEGRDRLRCRGRGPYYDLGIDDFQVHPLLEWATLRLGRDGRHGTVDWTGKGAEPERGVHASIYREFADVTAGLWRRASADATIFDRRMRTESPPDWGVLVEWTGAFAEAEQLVPGLSVTGSEDEVVVTKTVRR